MACKNLAQISSPVGTGTYWYPQGELYKLKRKGCFCLSDIRPTGIVYLSGES